MDKKEAKKLTKVGIKHYKQERYHEALECYNKVLAENPTFFRALLEKANALLKIGRIEEGRTFACISFMFNPGYEYSPKKREKYIKDLWTPKVKDYLIKNGLISESDSNQGKDSKLFY
ncbi:unnamed protein product [marine sediment metagenome]|uniref:Uncharacterized protein n=1 Tax=marine sediment metagenome TaxID=412755 RepID=X0SHW2_9ZZZZ